VQDHGGTSWEMAAPRQFSRLEARDTRADACRPVLVYSDVTRISVSRCRCCRCGCCTRPFQPLQCASTLLSRKLPDRLELIKPQSLIGGEFMNCLRRWTLGHKAAFRTCCCTIVW